jgi:hypothetical protein
VTGQIRRHCHAVFAVTERPPEEAIGEWPTSDRRQRLTGRQSWIVARTTRPWTLAYGEWPRRPNSVTLAATHRRPVDRVIRTRCDSRKR